MNLLNELIIILDRMATLIDRVADLPKSCPELKNCKEFIDLDNDIKDMIVYMKEKTKIALAQKVADTTTKNPFNLVPDKKRKDN